MPSRRLAGFLFFYGLSIFLPRLTAASTDSTGEMSLADSVFSEPVAKAAKPAKSKGVKNLPLKTPSVTKSQKLKTAKGFLAVYSDPAGAELIFNSVKQGLTPKMVRLTRKSNRIVLRMQGFESYDAMIEKQTLRREINVSLKPLKEKTPSPTSQGHTAPSRPVATSSSLPNAPVHPEVQASPQMEVEPADTLSRMRIPEKTVAPIVSSSSEAPVGTSDALGLVFFSSSPAHADIAIDGRPTGKQTPVKIELAPGVHHVEMQFEGLKGVADDSVNTGKNKALHLQLQ